MAASLCPSLWPHREHILDFLRVDYASVGECQFAVLECPAVRGSDEVPYGLGVFDVSVLVALEPVDSPCHLWVWIAAAYVHETLRTSDEEREYEALYLPVQKKREVEFYCPSVAESSPVVGLSAPVYSRGEDERSVGEVLRCRSDEGDELRVGHSLEFVALIGCECCAVHGDCV